VGVASAADLDAALQDAGDAVVFGAQTTYGLLQRHPIEGALDGGLAIGARDSLLAVRDGDPKLAGLANGSAITVAGAAYKVRDLGFARPSGLRDLVIAEA
jgi:hypothetical protein